MLGRSQESAPPSQCSGDSGTKQATCPVCVGRVDAGPPKLHQLTRRERDDVDDFAPHPVTAREHHRLRAELEEGTGRPNFLTWLHRVPAQKNRGFRKIRSQHLGMRNQLLHQVGNPFWLQEKCPARRDQDRVDNQRDIPCTLLPESSENRRRPAVAEHPQLGCSDRVVIQECLQLSCDQLRLHRIALTDALRTLHGESRDDRSRAKPVLGKHGKVGL